MRKAAALTLFVLLSLVPGALAQPATPQEVPIWPEGSPILKDGIRRREEKDADFLTNVATPTLLVYPPRVKPNGTSVVIFPGGGYLVLAMGLEGSEIAAWLNKFGITCFVLKYRVPYSGCYWDGQARKHVTPKVPMALQDAQRALSLVRSRAQEYHIHPDRIGVMGFSAGGNLAVLASTSRRAYPPQDAVDEVSCRPDFAIPVYPGHLTMTHKNIDSNALNTDIVVTRQVPPTLLIHAKDDPVDPVIYSKVYAEALKKAGVDVTLKLYTSGGHAFGVRKHGTDSDRWERDALVWMKQHRLL